MGVLKDGIVFSTSKVTQIGLDASGDGATKDFTEGPGVVHDIYYRVGSGTDADPYRYYYYNDNTGPEDVDWNGITADETTTHDSRVFRPGEFINTSSVTIKNGSGFAIFVDILHN